MFSRSDVVVSTDETPAAIGKAYRSKLQVVPIAVGLAVVAAIALGEGWAYPAAAERTFWWVMAGVSVALLVRAIRSGIFVQRGGLLVRAMATTRLCRWEDIVGFDQLRANSYKDGAAYIAVKLKDGSYAKTAGLTGTRDGTFARVVLGELKEHLQSHRVADPCARDSPSNRPDDASEVP